MAEEFVSPAVTAENGLSDESYAQQRTWKDVLVEMTRAAPLVMLGVAFVAGTIFAKRRR